MAFRAGSTATAGDSASTTRTLTRGAGWATDDIIIVQFYSEDTPFPTVAAVDSVSGASYTRITQIDQSLAATDFSTTLFYRRLTAGDTGNVSLTWGGSSHWNVAIGAAYTGRITSGDPQDATTTTNLNGSSNSTLTGTGLTPANASADIVTVGGNPTGSAYSAWSGGATERIDFAGSGLADFAHTSGATGNITATIGAPTSTAWTAFVAALQVAGAGGATPIRLPSRIAMLGMGA